MQVSAVISAVKEAQIINAQRLFTAIYSIAEGPTDGRARRFAGLSIKNFFMSAPASEPNDV